MQFHPLLEPLRFLVGTWRGDGHGVYPTIQPFDYTEEITFVPGPGKPFLAYTQRTWRASTTEPLHSETGYLRALGSDAVELVIAQPTGIAELHTGTVEDQSVVLRGVAFTTPDARPVTATVRKIEADENTLRYTMEMEAVGQPLQHHLAATLTRVGN